MKRKLFTFVMAVAAVLACAFCFVACTGDVSAVNGTYVEYAVKLDASGKIVSGYVVTNGEEPLTATLKDGEMTMMGTTVEYSMDGDDIVFTAVGKVTYKKVSDGVYLNKLSDDYSVCLVRDDVTPPFEVSENPGFIESEE